MKAIVIHAAKDLRLEEQPVPDLAPDEIQIEVATGGVCGSDLHYYNHGGFGVVRLKEPMVLGHEGSGHVVKLGADVTGFKTGDLVAVSPSRPCHACQYCLTGAHNQCLHMRFYGSAMPFPHIQGAFRQTLNASASQCVVAENLSSGEAAMAEPLSVVLHAMKQAGDLLGRRVLVTGCGPIGVLAVLAARRAGALEIVATDLSENALEFAENASADHIINSTDRDSLERYRDNKGYFDVVFECSGAESALHDGIHALSPKGVMVQLGLGGDMSVPMMAVTAKELQLRGSFRFHEEFSTAIELMSRGLIDVKPLITHTVKLDHMEEAFTLASDRNLAMKAQIDFQ